MNATRAKQLLGLIMLIGLGLSLTAPPAFPPSRLLLTDAVKKSDAANKASQSSSRAATPESIEQTKERVGEAYGQLPISFEVNRGQTDSSVKFLARGRGYNLFLTATEAVLSLRKAAPPSVRENKMAQAGRRESSSLASHASSQTSTLRMKIVGADPEAQVAGEEQLPGEINYFTGRDAGNWQRAVASYAKVRYQNIYAGVDLIYYGNQRELEYDFVVSPGVDPATIKLAIAGARKMSVAENGDLVLRTAVGELRQHKPIAYQETDGTRQEVVARYVVKGRQIGFQVDDYDTTRPLVIDPVLSYSTYLGGGGNYEVGFGVAVDAEGNAYVVGTTASADYPVTPGAPQSAIGGGNSLGDAFVTKLNATGTALVYSTYLGGSGRDFAYDIALDADGNAYVMGNTESNDFPTSAGAFQTSHGSTNGTEDGFVTKLNAAGSSILYSTYLGGNSSENCRAIAVNSQGEAYITGATNSANFPSTPGAYRTVTGGYSGNADVFLTKLNASGTALVFSTYLGASSGFGLDLALDASGNIYLAGETYAGTLGGDPNNFTFPVTPDAYQSAPGAEGFEGFISKVSADGTQLLYSSYFGGNMEDSITGVALDSSDNLYVAGYTGSTNLPVTPGCAQPALASPYDAFIAKFNFSSPDTPSLVYLTYLGGSSGEDTHGIEVDSAGNAFVAGYTWSSDFPATETYGPGWTQAFVTKLNATGTQFIASTRLGDTYTYGYDLALDSAGNAYVVGQITSSNFPVTPGVVQPTLAGGGSDSFITKLDYVTQHADLAISMEGNPSPAFPNLPIHYFVDITNNGPHQATNVTLTHQLPAGVTYSSAGPMNGAAGFCTNAGTTVNCDAGNLEPNTTVRFILAVIVTAPAGTTLENTASVTSATIDPNAQNNSASVSIEVIEEADLYGYATVTPNFVESGSNVTYTVDVTNGGPTPASSVTLSGTLPNVTLNNIGNAHGSCTTAPGGGGTSFNCTLGDFDINTTKSLTLTGAATGAPYTELPLNATIGSSTPDPYLDNNNVFTMALIAAAPLPSPTPGPGGDAQLAYQKSDPNISGSDIFRQRADGAGLLNLTNAPAAINDFVWSPDGSRIAFEVSDITTDGINLYVMNADGSNQMRLTNAPEQHRNIAWSPDGTRIAFNSYDSSTGKSTVLTINADGTNLTPLTPGTDYDGQPSWSPDSSRILFTRSIYDADAGTFNADIHVMNADGTNDIMFSSNAIDSDYNPAWSPDGSQIAFVRAPNDQVNAPDLFIANPDGTNIRRLTTNYSVSTDTPKWSPNGSKLAFLGAPDNGQYLLNLINPDGTGLQPISGSVESISSIADWSPDGSKLAFSVSYGEVLNGLYVVGANGAGLVHIGDDREYNNRPVWSPDSSKLAFSSSRNAINSIDLINADGTGRVELSREGFRPKWRPAPPPNTPAGANVAVAQNGATLTFANVTQAGQTTVTPIDPNSLSGVPGEYVINANTLAFEITTTATYTGPITIGFQVPGVNNPITFSTLRVLHGEPPPVPNFIDRTILAPDSPSHDFPTRTVYARVNSLSPFVIAERAEGDTTPPVIQITRPTNSIYLLNQSVISSYSCTDTGGSGVATCVGTVANNAAINTASVGAKVFTVNATDGAGNTASKSVNYTVAYGVKTLHDVTKLNKSGSTVQLELQLLNAASLNVSSAGIPATAISVTRVSSTATGSIEEYNDDDPDSNFVFQNGQNSYRFKLKTTGYAAGTYLLSFRAGNDPTIHTVEFRIRQ